MKNSTIYIKANFTSTFRKNNPDLSSADNFQTYGKCCSINYNINRYELVVKLTPGCELDDNQFFDKEQLGMVIREILLDKWDRKNLDDVFHATYNLAPNTENLAKVAYDLLRERIDENFYINVYLYETNKTG